MVRIADPYRLRAEAVELDWLQVARHRAERLGRAVDWNRVESRATDVRVLWACAAELGVPREPFMVWRRASGGTRPDRVDARATTTAAGIHLRWDEYAGRVMVTCEAINASQPVGLLLYGPPREGVTGVVGQTTAPPTGGRITLDARTTGADRAVLVNGHSPRVFITTLQDIVNAPDWEPLERVGLPVDDPWPGTAYDTSEQGLAASPVAPVKAALQRLRRGAPPLGWDALIPSGLAAPPWEEPDPDALVADVRAQVLTAVRPLYDPGLREFAQHRADAWQVTDPPHAVGATSPTSLKAQTDPKPWAVLGMSAHVDPFLNLATGFGTVYSADAFGPDDVMIGDDELMVTGRYEHRIAEGAVIDPDPDVGLPPDVGPAEFAAYAPRGEKLTKVAAPSQVTATRTGLVEPPTIDEPWGESIRLSHHRPPVGGMLGRPTQQAAAAAEDGAIRAEPLIERRQPQGWRTSAITSDPPAAPLDDGPASFMHSPAEIRIGSGGRTARYALAVADVFGVWSPWREAPYSGGEPKDELPAIVSARLETDYEDSPIVQTALEIDVAVEWTERTSARIDIRALFLHPPPASGATAPTPTTPASGGGFARDLRIDFDLAGTATSADGTLVELNRDGTSPLGAEPRGETRRFRLTVSVPALNFQNVARWGAALWTRRMLRVNGSVTGWSPRTVAEAPSPLPPPLTPLPASPGVPLASLPDADGRSHAAVSWTPVGATVARTAIVWECTETSLRQVAKRDARAKHTESPSDRLVALRAAYADLTPAKRRSAFRRIAEVDAALGSVDVPLPRGSQDIHLFTVTLVSPAGIENDWPEGPPDAPHAHLRATIAPTLVRPAPPSVRATPVSGAGGPEVRLRMTASSRLPITHFRLLRTVGAQAGLRADTMGPPFAEPAAQEVMDPIIPTKRVEDPATGDPVWEAVWQGPLPPDWRPWLLRAIAVPEPVEQFEGLRGRASEASDIVTCLALPVTPPVLDALAGEDDAAHTGLVVRTGTTAPASTRAIGDHVLRARIRETGVAEVEVPPIALPATGEGDVSAAPAGGGPTWVRGPRDAGRSPLALWFARTDAASAVEIEVTLTDPQGRSTTQTTTIPGWVPPQPPPATLTLLSIKTVPLRGTTATVHTSAKLRSNLVVRVVVAPKRRFPFAPVERHRPIVADVPLRAIPVLPRGPVTINGVTFQARTRGLGRLRGTAISIGVRIGPSLSISVSLIAPDGSEVTVTGSV